MARQQPENILLERPACLVHFFAFSRGGVLFSAATRRIMILNHSAAVIWCLLGRVSTMEGLVTEMTRYFPVDRTTAARDTRAVLTRLRAQGFIGPGPPPAQPPAAAGLPDLATKGPQLAGPRNWAFRQAYQLLDHRIEFRIQDPRLAASFRPLMQQLADENSPTADTEIWVLPGAGEGNTWEILLDRRSLFEEVPAAMVLPRLFYLAFAVWCSAFASRLLLHAAVLAKGGRVILFPATAGSGKTTLAAILVSRGWRFYSDELAVLNVEKLTVAPFALPMSIKPGSVTQLAGRYPGLQGAEIHQRVDGKGVRYLVPPLAQIAGPGEEAPIGAVVFPRFQGPAAGSLVELDKAGALVRLAESCSSDRELIPDDIKAMIRVVEQGPCLELVFSGPGEAVGLLEEWQAGAQSTWGSA